MASNSNTGSGSNSIAIAADLADSLDKANFGLDIVLCAASLGCFIGVLFLRRRVNYDLKALPIWAILASLAAVFLFEIFNLPVKGHDLGHTPSQSQTYINFYSPALILSSFFKHVAICLLFYIFYQITHICARYATDGKHPPFTIRTLHWFIFGIIVATAIIDWIFIIPKVNASRSTNLQGNRSANYGNVAQRSFQMDSATQIIRWVASGDILAWDIYLVTKAFRTSPDIRVSTIFGLFGSVFFFALNMMWAIFDINYFLARGANVVSTAIAGVGITQAIFFMVVYVGLLSFCMRWGLLRRQENPTDADPALPRVRQTPAEMEANSRPSHIMETQSSMIVEADGRKQILEADSRPVVEADSRVQDARLKDHNGYSKFQ